MNTFSNSSFWHNHIGSFFYSTTELLTPPVLQPRVAITNPDIVFSDPTTLALTSLVGLTLLAIIVITLWPNRRSTDGLYQRQRKFARIDGLNSKMQGFVFTERESREFLKNKLSLNDLLLSNKDRRSLPVTLCGLSTAGCNLTSTYPLKKGTIIILQLETLPDFPAKNLTVGVKVVWTRTETKEAENLEVAGGKFIYAASPETTEYLRQYVNYLMDEAVT